MDDDFAANLQDVDGTDVDGRFYRTLTWRLRKISDDQTERDEAFEDNIEWNQGCVDEPDERQELDSDLWDKPQEVAPPGIDDESSGMHFCSIHTVHFYIS